MISKNEFMIMVQNHIETQKKEIIKKHIENANRELEIMIRENASEVALKLINQFDYRVGSDSITIEVKTK